MIDFHKFEFVYCVNNDQQFQESWSHIRALNIPPGYEVAKKTIKTINSITTGYNQAMNQSNAKYKIYLHQDVNILNSNFLYDILFLFQKYPNIGMLGVLGAKKIPPNGIWWDAPERYGKVFYFNSLVNCMDVTADFESVQAIDGMIMITQYDLKWREDLLMKWHFYDTSHSLEFLKAGFSIGVPRQIEPWCSHNTLTAMLTFQKNQAIFLNEYRQFLT